MKYRIFSIALLVLSFSSAHAVTWDDLWLNPDEQAYKALTQDNPQQAALLFQDPQWQGIAYYRMGDYKKALQAFSKDDDATAWYNRGNALAYLGQYQDAINAYDKALDLDTQLKDAQFNRDLLKQLLNNTASPPTPQEATPPPFKKNYQNKNEGNGNSNDQTSPPPQNNATPPPTTNTPQNNPQPQNSLPPTTNTNGQAQTVSGSYQDQQQQQSLQNMSDDPGGLLQRKLSRDYTQSQQQGD